ncbi:MAG: hypothetical protein IH969_03370, partial [Candidatus Krumholzibacteriota bacterium]|nr:hypothetical protein [Candidatus Krumholzibacteriota bacterium]
MDAAKRSDVVTPEIGSDCYDAYYFRHCCGKPYARTDEWLAAFDRFAERIVSDIGPTSVLDAG